MTQSTQLEKKEPEERYRPSTYLRYLPIIYGDDEFMGRFLRIFEDVLTPIEQEVGQLHLCFDSTVTREDFLPWLASWVGLVFDEGWPLERRRRLVLSAVQLYRLRGTRAGLSEYLRIYTGVVPDISEQIGGIRLGSGSRLGWNTVLGDGRDHCFTVALRLGKGRGVDLAKVRAIIEAEKPAEAAYRLEIIAEEQP